MVLVIMAILAGLLVPTMSAFAAGRRTSHAATLVLGLANYARTQSLSEGTVYRVNFDAAAGQVWLTKSDQGAFTAPANDYGQRFTLPQGVRMSVEVTPGSVVVPIADPNVQQTTVQQAPLFGQSLADPNTLVQVPHADGGTYLELRPGGRSDPCHVHLSDDLGHAVDLGAATATDIIHVLQPGEM